MYNTNNNCKIYYYNNNNNYNDNNMNAQWSFSPQNWAINLS